MLLLVIIISEEIPKDITFDSWDEVEAFFLDYKKKSERLVNQQTITTNQEQDNMTNQKQNGITNQSSSESIIERNINQDTEMLSENKELVSPVVGKRRPQKHRYISSIKKEKKHRGNSTQGIYKCHICSKASHNSAFHKNKAEDS
ncbi:2459_t:CDS:2 [Scutellospora calospora]|uniref:2459_t:CDS:1 n=1 Tax=Scutellospora calospora TaxID=85575 RepID=A0ACA9K7N0_9GLOM|nr:2459_t:CDS:2 [Scutellospora calospora]